VLEAIHFLGLTRSFRGNQFRHLVQEGETRALVFAQTDSLGTGQVKPGCRAQPGCRRACALCR
jgi:DNA replication and repair protein RecF